LTPFKTCTYDCIYCQLGRTTEQTTRRREFFPPGEIIADVRQALSQGPQPDHVTLAGSGEPTLYQPLDEIIAAIKRLTSAPVVVLTNGSLLHDPQVRAEIAGADVLMPSLDAASEELYQKINRPHPELPLARVLAGLRAARQEFAGRYWLEVMLLEGLSAEPQAIEELAAEVSRIQPDQVQLNTVARPPAESWAEAVSAARLQACAARLGQSCTVITDHAPEAELPDHEGTREAVLALLQRRPCRLEDIAQGLNLHRNAVTKYLSQLLRAGAITQEQQAGVPFYRAPADQ
jgi:wyosine [tRNA(Phe)-imidazoG37] synthetase (radical SAM superfamily)